MRDAILNRSMRLTVVGMIAATGFAALILGYQGFFELLWGNFAAAGAKLAWGAGSGAAALLLMRYRDDLIDD